MIVFYLAFTWAIMYTKNNIKIHFSFVLNFTLGTGALFNRISNLTEDNPSGDIYLIGNGEFGACNETRCTNYC